MCKYCEGTGKAHHANGPDDYTVGYCVCEAGQEKMENDHDVVIDREVDEALELNEIV